MRISITYSMVLTALALSSTTLAAPSTQNSDEHAVFRMSLLTILMNASTDSYVQMSMLVTWIRW